MRNKLLVCAVTLLISVAGRSNGQAVELFSLQRVTLTWEYPISSPDIVFNVYYTTNLALPKMSWTLVTNVTETRCTLTIVQPGAHFFTVTASNRVTGLESFR